MKPTILQYEAPEWGIGEVWLDEKGRVFYSELPRPRARSKLRGSSEQAQSKLRGSSGLDLSLPRRLVAYFAGEADDFRDVPLVLDGGFHGECAKALRTVKRGQVVTYGELAALAGRPRAARAAGTFCARCNLAPFLPVHRVVASDGIGSWGADGVEYKRRMLELEGVVIG